MQPNKNLNNIIDDISSWIKCNHGEKESEKNIDSHPHKLFIEIDDGLWHGCWVFTSVHTIMQILSSSEFSCFLSIFSNKQYLINIETRK